MTVDDRDKDRRRPLALVTGASSGIGQAFVDLLASKGYDVVAVARTLAPIEDQAARLKADHGASIFAVGLDLTQPDAAESLVGRVKSTGKPLQLLINNAGFGVVGAFADLDRREQLAMIDLNARVVADLIHVFLPDLKTTRGGIINVASLSALMPMPYMAIYGATKSFVLTFSKLLRKELKSDGVRVTALCPGYTSSAFHKRAGVDKISLPKLLPKQTSKEVAERGYRAWSRGRAVVVTGVFNKLSAIMAKPLQPVMNLVGKEASKRING
jgi:uncharacterized protein